MTKYELKENFGNYSKGEIVTPTEKTSCISQVIYFSDENWFEPIEMCDDCGGDHVTGDTNNCEATHGKMD